MDENLETPRREQLKAWTKKQLDTAVRELMNLGVIDSLIIEAKPAWVLPFQILIGKIRARGQSKNFGWFICGEVPTDFLKSTLAATPRDAARHFAMKWQLKAARHRRMASQEPGGTEPESGQEDPGDQLVFKAEALYSLVDDARLWLQEETT